MRITIRIERVVCVALAVASMVAVSFPATAQRGSRCRDQEPTTWDLRIASENEPGQQMVVHGTVLAADGKTPQPGVTVYVFHTDNKGYYSPGGMDEDNVRLCGILRTDDRGRYRFSSVRPAEYATGNGPPAHVHFEVWGHGLAEQQFILYFEDDPRHEGKKGAEPWSNIRPATRDDSGALVIRRDLKLR